MKNPLVALAMLVAVSCLGMYPSEQEQKKQPEQQQQKQQRMEIPADATFYQDVSWSPDGGSIIFCSRRDGAEKSAVYTMKADGSEMKKLTEDQGFFARFSPDGGRVAFTTQGFPKNAIFVMRADGSDLKRLTP